MLFDDLPPAGSGDSGETGSLSAGGGDVLCCPLTLREATGLGSVESWHSERVLEPNRVLYAGSTQLPGTASLLSD